MYRNHSMPSMDTLVLSPSSTESIDSAAAKRAQAAAMVNGAKMPSPTQPQYAPLSSSLTSHSYMPTSGSPPHFSPASHPPAPIYLHASSSSPSLVSPPTYTVIPATVTTASVVPSAAQPPVRRRRPKGVRSPGHNRVPLWDTVRNKKLSGFASPMEKNLKKYLEEHPNCVLYDKSLAQQHKQANKQAQSADAINGANDSDSDSNDEMPPELERIITNDNGINSAHSISPSNSPAQPINIQADSSPASPLAATNNGVKVRFPPPLSSSLPSSQSPMPATTLSPAHSPTTHKMQQDFEALTVNGLELGSRGLSPKSRKSRRQTREQSPRRSRQPIAQYLTDAIAPPMHGLHGSSSSNSLASYDTHDSHHSQLTHYEYAPISYPALSSSVPVSSIMHAINPSRPLTVDTHFDSNHPHHRANGDDMPRGLRETASYSVLSTETGSSSAVSSPRAAGVHRKARSSSYHQRVHPYSDRSTPTRSELRVNEEHDEYASPYRPPHHYNHSHYPLHTPLSHSLPQSGHVYHEQLSHSLPAHDQLYGHYPPHSVPDRAPPLHSTQPHHSGYLEDYHPPPQSVPTGYGAPRYDTGTDAHVVYDDHPVTDYRSHAQSHLVVPMRISSRGVGRQTRVGDSSRSVSSESTDYSHGSSRAANRASPSLDNNHQMPVYNRHNHGHSHPQALSQSHSHYIQSSHLDVHQSFLPPSHDDYPRDPAFELGFDAPQSHAINHSASPFPSSSSQASHSPHHGHVSTPTSMVSSPPPPPSSSFAGHDRPDDFDSVMSSGALPSFDAPFHQSSNGVLSSQPASIYHVYNNGDPLTDNYDELALQHQQEFFAFDSFQ